MSHISALRKVCECYPRAGWALMFNGKMLIVVRSGPRNGQLSTVLCEKVDFFVSVFLYGYECK